MRRVIYFDVAKAKAQLGSAPMINSDSSKITDLTFPIFNFSQLSRVRNKTSIMGHEMKKASLFFKFFIGN